MVTTRKKRSRVRRIDWGLAPNRRFLDELAYQLNDETVARNRWLQVSERQIDDPAVTHRLVKIRFGSIQARLTMRADLARKYGAICATRVILEPSMPLAPFPARLAEQTITKFRRLGARHPAQLDLINVTQLGLQDGPEREKVGRPLVAVPLDMVTIQSPGADPCGAAVAQIWRLMGLPERDRLKRCPTCGTWFVDPTRPKRKISCGPRCHEARWNRRARRAAGHAQYRTGGRRKRGRMR
jgi:hypothetical protein